MPALSPTYASRHLAHGITEYLTTSFSLADPGAAQQLEEFLTASESSLFYGPYIRTKLPFAPAENWEGVLRYMPKGFVPYRHQAEAFARLSAKREGVARRPEPTLVVTGTGSGKTESFLLPLLDHCAQHPGGGVKALILYPMNALANDQERRLAELICEEPAFRRVRAAIYTGEQRLSQRKVVSPEGIITDRDIIRQNPPDILLTNYKMLDQLLLRDDDQRIWQESAASLQYLVLDEFHTYDAAQGTDVAMLLRRLGLKIKGLLPAGTLDAEAQARPLGKITPVATSATLGGAGESEGVQDMLDFAYTIFGEQMGPDAIVGETALTLEQWEAGVDELVGAQSAATGMPTWQEVEAINEAIAALCADGETYEAAVHHVLSQKLFRLASGDSLSQAISAAAHNALVREVLRHTSTPCRLGDKRDIERTEDDVEPEDLPLYKRVFGRDIARRGERAIDMVVHVLTEIAYLRAEFGKLRGWEGKRLPGVETQLWVREMSQVDRAVGQRPGAHAFRWTSEAHDAGSSNGEYWLPAIYCRHCGRSGWMLAARPGESGLETNPQRIRRESLHTPSRQRPLIHALNEGADDAQRPVETDSRFGWINLELPGVVTDPPSEKDLETGGVAPVLTYAPDKAEELAQRGTCPACGERDGIRYLGSSISTLLSVATSNLFGMDDLGEEEKRTLVFTDSVQDAAHRAGFVQARARTFALRTRIRQAVGDDGTLTLPELTQAVMSAADAEPRPDRARFELLPPELAEKKLFAPYWSGRAGKKDTLAAEHAVRERLNLDIALEFGDRADLPRSLVSTGALGVQVKITAEEVSEILDELNLSEEPATRAWVHGILEYLRLSGAIESPLLSSYLRHGCNQYLLNRREARARGIPAFPRGGAPHFPQLGASGRKPNENWDCTLQPASTRSWFARWTRQVLGITTTHDAARLCVELLHACVTRGILHSVPSEGGGNILAIPATRVEVSVEDAATGLECDMSGHRLDVAGAAREALRGAPSMTLGSEGHYQETTRKGNYYRTLYASQHPRTVVAKEHTSLLADEQRREVEEEFKKPAEKQAANAPNVLVATPTLEMGIDIGSLSVVMLSSLPRSVANYVQRVGRAGRLSGNSLVLAFARGRGPSLLKLSDPLDTIGGAVNPPAAYLSAREILHRQFLAYLIDSHPLPEGFPPPRDAYSLFRDHGPTLLGLIEEWVDTGIHEDLAAFRATLAGHTPDDVLEELEHWAREELKDLLRETRRQWSDTLHTLGARKRELVDARAQLDKDVNSGVADDDVKEEYRSTLAALRLVEAQLRTAKDEYWISAMERYGLLPNFTLFDDSVEFDLSIERYTEEGQFAPEVRNYSRSSASALEEFAPGSTFYVQGVAAKVDSVDLGAEGEAITQWRLCPECSYSEIIDPAAEATTTPATCPCGTTAGYADSSQVINVVEMTKVYASVDENRSAIDGSHDDRVRPSYQTTLSYVVPESTPRAPWFLQQTGFGVEYLSAVELRWLNLGIRTHGQQLRCAGETLDAPFFRVCRHCGHLDSQAGSNSWRDHQRWCPQRHATTEDSTTFALGRRMNTQGVLLHLPPSFIAADSTSLPSLVAAIRMGFKEHLGGDPSHLHVSPVKGTSNGRTIDMLLLHDAVPGGTGYLAAFASPSDIRAMLEKTYRRLRNSLDDALASPGGPRAGVYRNCLLPFAHGLDVTQVSQDSALALLTRILADDDHPDNDCEPLDISWTGRITERYSRPDASELEVRFRELFINDLEEAGATVSTSVSRNIRTWSFAFPGSPHTWTMSEQKEFGYTRPDYYFHTPDPAIRDIALYLDGAQYHLGHVDGDIAKRNRLYATGTIIPWTLTWEDTVLRQRVKDGEGIAAPPWYNPVMAAGLAQLQGVTERDMQQDPFTQLLELLKRPTDHWGKLAVCSYVFAAQTDTLPACIRTERFGENGLRLVLDAGGTPMDPEAWRTFLRLTDHFYLSGKGENPIEIRVEGMGEAQAEEERPALEKTAAEAGVAGERGGVAVSAGVAGESGAGVPGEPTVPEGWAEAFAEYEGDPEEEILRELARRGYPAPDNLGDKEINGIPTIVGWTAQRTYLVDPEDIAELDHTDLHIYGATRESIEEMTS